MNTGFEFSLLSLELQAIENIDMFDFGFGDFEMGKIDDEYEDDEYKEIEKQYGESDTLSTAVTIICMNDDEKEFIKKLIKEDKDLKKIYRVKDMMEKFDER